MFEESQIVEIDMEELEKNIPRHWMRIHHKKIMEISTINFSVLLNHYAAKHGLSEPCGTKEINHLYKLESRRTGIEADLIQQMIFDNAASQASFMVFNQEYGQFLPKDQSGQTMLPVEMMSRFFGEKGAEAEARIKEQYEKEEGLKMHCPPMSNMGDYEK